MEVKRETWDYPEGKGLSALLWYEIMGSTIYTHDSKTRQQIIHCTGSQENRADCKQMKWQDGALGYDSTLSPLTSHLSPALSLCANANQSATLHLFLTGTVYSILPQVFFNMSSMHHPAHQSFLWGASFPPNAWLESNQPGCPNSKDLISYL